MIRPSAFAGDIRYACRAQLSKRGFSLIAVLALGLGVGVTTAVISLVDIVLFRPLPAKQPHELVRIGSGNTKAHLQCVSCVSFPDYLDYRERARSFTGLAAYVDRLPVNLSIQRTEPQRAVAGMVTGNYFSILGVGAEVGRAILESDDRPGAPPVAMLSHDFWRRTLGHDSESSVLGSTAIIDGQPFTVIGVTPAGFGGISFDNLPQVWIPMSYAFQIDPLLHSQIPLKAHSYAPFSVVGRLKPQVSLQQAQSELDTIGGQLGAGKPLVPAEGDYTKAWPVAVDATQAARIGRSNFGFLIVAIAAMVLLIVCADLSGLLIARSESRRQETAVRLALGASRGRILSLHLAEGLLLALPGGAAGVLVARWIVPVIAAGSESYLPVPLDRAASILDPRILAFALAAALLAALVSCIAPAIRQTRTTAMASMRSAAGTGFRDRGLLQSGLAVAQVAVSVVLVAGAALFIRTLQNAAAVPLGFDAEHTAGASTDLVRRGYDKNYALTMLDPILDSLQAQPGMQSAALGVLPFQTMQTTVEVERKEGAHGSASDGIQLARVSPGYFSTLGIPLLSGRDFTRADSASSPGVAIVNQAMARKFWPDTSPIGRHILHVGIHDQSFEVIGVAGNVASYDLGASPPGVAYFSLSQSYVMFPWQPDVTMLTRSANPEAALGQIQAAVNRVDPQLPVFHFRTMQQQAGIRVLQQAFLGRLLALLAALATLLALAGVYGLFAYRTQLASHDLGIRAALGAQPQGLLWLVLRRGIIFASAGILIGIGMALLASRAIASLLYGVTPTDPATFAGVAALMLFAAMAACYFPARTAMKTDPMNVLRHE